jgi:AcrR family transcriptional regulator
MVTEMTRRPRSDAARNQRLIIDAAVEVFAEQGVDASMEEIAARAGVGVGTVYRRFPGKDWLVDELVRLVVSDLVASGEKALARTDGTGLEMFLRALGKSFAEHRRYAGLVLGRTRSDCGASTVRRQIVELFDAAQQARAVGPDVRFGDVMALVWGMRGVVEASGDIAPDAWKRYLDVHLAGLRQTGRLSTTPAITPAQVTRLSNKQ